MHVNWVDPLLTSVAFKTSIPIRMLKPFFITQTLQHEGRIPRIPGRHGGGHMGGGGGGGQVCSPHCKCVFKCTDPLPVSMDIVVVFPAPLCPSKAVICPLYMSKLRLSTAFLGGGCSKKYPNKRLNRFYRGRKSRIKHYITHGTSFD